MQTRAEQFFTWIKGRKVGFIGVGVSHTQLIRLFCQKGAKVSLRDRRTAQELGELAQELQNLGVELILGETYLDHFTEEVLLRSPGVYYNLPAIQRARQEGIVVTSEMELFFDLCPCPTVAVTGSDGKTTTTTLISEMLKAQGKTVHLGGNIGRALLPEIEQIRQEDVAVVELSSFQLISMRCAPTISVVTNICQNHMDVHGTMEEYIGAKQNIFLHQNAFSRTVLNGDNDITCGFLPQVRGVACTFSRRTVPQRGAYLGEDGILYYTDGKTVTPVMEQKEIVIPGLHNVENYLAAITALWGLVSVENFRKVAASFHGVEHRIEFVRELDGVRYYNDSIATTPSRTMAALNAFPDGLILLAGGYDKKLSFEPMAQKVNENVKILILMGATAHTMAETFQNHPSHREGTPQIYFVENMEQAIQKARSLAQPGDVVALSPACASFGLYRNFEERGKDFKTRVLALED